jgi:gluconokinase
MKDFAVRSPGAKVGGIVYFGRMLDKIRVHAKGELPAEYQGNLGERFDRWCVDLLQVDYQKLADRVKEGGTDEEILDWCFARGRKPAEGEIHVWNEFMRKRGWNDELTETLVRRMKEAGMADRSEIRTMFNFIDADEGRPIADGL